MYCGNGPQAVSGRLGKQKGCPNYVYRKSAKKIHLRMMVYRKYVVFLPRIKLVSADARSKFPTGRMDGKGQLTTVLESNVVMEAVH